MLHLQILPRSYVNKLQILSQVHATMCLFGYYIYDGCGHKGIEIVSHCVECLWKAGIDGQLWACPEVQYIRHLIQLSPLTWEGKYGYCKYCQMIYVVGLPCIGSRIHLVCKSDLEVCSSEK
jgi:hypothetical protein